MSKVSKKGCCNFFGSQTYPIWLTKKAPLLTLFDVSSLVAQI